MYIVSNNNRFDIQYSKIQRFENNTLYLSQNKTLDEKGILREDKKRDFGISGFHGRFANVIGLLLEKIFHKTVAIKAENGTFYLNCNSLEKWFDRVSSVKISDIKKNIHNSGWVQQQIEAVLNSKVKPEEKQLIDALSKAEVPDQGNKDDVVDI